MVVGGARINLFLSTAGNAILTRSHLPRSDSAHVTSCTATSSGSSPLMADISPEKDGDYFSRRESSSQTPRARRIASETFRPRVTALQTPNSPTSPRTPRAPLGGRSSSSNFGSPGLGFRQDDDYFVFEFSELFLRAGLGGEPDPRCELSFGPKSQRMVGNHSPYLAVGDAPRRRAMRGESYESWGRAHEMWRMDLRKVDLALVADKVERSLRDAIRDHILVLDDSKKRRAILVIPPLVPQPLLSVLCTKIFDLFPPSPSITVLSTPTLCAIAAGMRSALVVDVGWSMSTVTAVYEYREVRHRTSTRGMKLLSWRFREMLAGKQKVASTGTEETFAPSFDDVEEIVHRMAWCVPDCKKHMEEQTDAGKQIEVPLPSAQSPEESFSIPFKAFCDPVEAVFVSPENDSVRSDDEELPLSALMYSTLLTLSVDIRETCSRRILFTGKGSSIPGLKSRLLSAVSQIISSRGWDEVHNYGSAKSLPKRSTVTIPARAIAKDRFIATSSQHSNKDVDADSSAPASLQPQLPDPILANIRSRAAPKVMVGLNTSGNVHLRSLDADNKSIGSDVKLESNEDESQLQPHLRCVTSLGAWAGASLLAGLRIPGLVEIEREQFIHNGLHGRISSVDDRRKSMPAQQAQRQSLVGPAAGNSGKVDSAWTLGIWA